MRAYLLKTYFCEHTFKAISSIYQKIIRLYVKVVYCNLLSTKGKGELVAKWAKENVSDLIGYSVGLMSQWARLTPCFFLQCLDAIPRSTVSLEWWFYFAREFGWFIVLSQSTDPLHNVQFVKYDVTVSFLAQVLDTVAYLVSQVWDTASSSNCLVRFYWLAI